MVSSVALRKWVIIVPAREEANVPNLIRTMQQVSRPLGFEIFPEMQLYSTCIFIYGYGTRIAGDLSALVGRM